MLSSVELLLALEKHGSATRAARELETTPATVLRRLERLETKLSVRFFDRHPTGLKPTPVFALVRPWAEQAHAAAHGLLRQLTQVEQRPAGVVRLATPPAVASLFVVPALPLLRREFPDLVVELVPATAVVDLAQREADLAIRTIKPVEGELVVKRLASYRLAVVGARSLKPRVKGSKRAVDWDWLGWSSALSGTPEAQWLLEMVPDAKVVFRSSELGTLIAAAQQGLGALVMADLAAERAGGLVKLPVHLPPRTGSSSPRAVMPEGVLWLVAHQALRPVPRVAAVWNFLVAQIAAGGTRIGQ